MLRSSALFRQLGARRGHLLGRRGQRMRETLQRRWSSSGPDAPKQRHLAQKSWGTRYKATALVVGIGATALFLDYFHQDILDAAYAHAPVSLLLPLCELDSVPFVQNRSLRVLLDLATNDISARNVASDPLVLPALAAVLDEEVTKSVACSAEDASDATVLALCTLCRVSRFPPCRVRLHTSGWTSRLHSILVSSSDASVHAGTAALLQSMLQSPPQFPGESLKKRVNSIAFGPLVPLLVQCNLERLQGELPHSSGPNLKQLVRICEGLAPIGDKQRSPLYHRLKLSEKTDLQSLAVATLMCSLCSYAYVFADIPVEPVREHLKAEELVHKLDTLLQHWEFSDQVETDFASVAMGLNLVSLLAASDAVKDKLLASKRWARLLRSTLRADDPDLSLFSLVLLATLVEDNPGAASFVQEVGMGTIVKQVDRMHFGVSRAVKSIIGVMSHVVQRVGNTSETGRDPSRFALDESMQLIERE